MKEQQDKKEVRLSAYAVSRGVAVGKVVCLYGKRRHFYKIGLPLDSVEAELDRFRTAVRRAKSQINKLSTDHGADSTEVSRIFDVQQMILEGSSLIARVETAIKDQKVNAEWAVKIVADDYVERQKSASDEHIREKYLEVEDVTERLLTALAGGAGTLKPQLPPDSVIVAKEIWSSTLVEMAAYKPKAIITEHGGWTSHTSILSRGLNLPAVSGIKNVLRKISDGDIVLVDGIRGEVVLNPTDDTIERSQTVEWDVACDPEHITDSPPQTLDGREIIIRVNIDKPRDYARAEQIGAQGIGLLRTEFLFDHSNGFPSEAAQLKAYKNVADIAPVSGVKIRTFDIGIDQLTDDPTTGERNPSLGLRSIRLSLRNTRAFRTQIRALLQAAHERKLDIVLPMVNGVEEIARSRRIINEERTALQQKGIAVGNPDLGAMIETPSAVLAIGQIAAHVDFLCLGTNDLVQYLLAVDRDNQSVAEWYQTLHPAVIMAIKQVLTAGSKAGVPVIICGEIAGSAFYTPLLIGLGAREFSMGLNPMPQVRRLIAGIRYKDARKLVKQVESRETAAEIENILREYYRENWKNLFSEEIL